MSQPFSARINARLANALPTPMEQSLKKAIGWRSIPSVPGCYISEPNGSPKEFSMPNESSIPASPSPKSLSDLPDRSASRQATSLFPESDGARKAIPIFTGCVMYFPNALAAVAEVSRVGNDQHNPGQPLHWNRRTSMDQYNTAVRHLMDSASGCRYDTDGTRHLQNP